MQETLSYKPGSLLRLFEEKNLQMGNIRHYKYVSKICLTRFISPPTMKIIISLMRKNLKKLKVAYTFYYFPKTSPTVYPQYLLNHWRFALLPRLSKHLKVLKGEANFSYLKEFKNLLELDISTLEKKTKIPLFLTKLKTLDINNLQNSSSKRSLINIHRLKGLQNLKIQGHYSDICQILKKWESSRYQTNANLVISLSRFDNVNAPNSNFDSTTTYALQFPLCSKISSLSGNNQNNFSIFPLLALQFMKMPNLKVFRYIDIFKSVNNFNLQNAKLDSLRELKSLQNLSLNLSLETKDLNIIATLDDLYLSESLESLQLVIELPDSGVNRDYKLFYDRLRGLVNLKDFEFVARCPSSLRDAEISEQMLNLLFRSANQLPKKERLKGLKLRIQGVSFSPREAFNQGNVERFTRDLQEFSALEVFTLHTNTRIHKGEPMTLETQQIGRKLKSLNLNVNYFDEEAFSVMMNCPRLESLTIDIHSFITKDDFLAYFKIISQKLKNLSYLELLFNEISGVDLENYPEVAGSIKELFQSLTKIRDCFLCINDLVLPVSCADTIGEVFKWKKFISTCVIQTQYWSLYKNHLQNGSYTVKVATQTVL